MAVSALGYMPVIIDFAGLVAARGKTDPRPHRSRLPKVFGSSMAVAKDVAVIAPTPGIDIRMRQA